MKNRKQEKQRRKELTRRALVPDTQRKAMARALQALYNHSSNYYTHVSKSSKEYFKSLHNRDLTRLQDLRKGNSGPGYRLFRYRRIGRNETARKFYIKDSSPAGAAVWITEIHTKATTFKTRSAAQAYKDKYGLDNWTVE